jgi:hypothetical protein
VKYSLPAFLEIMYNYNECFYQALMNRILAGPPIMQADALKYKGRGDNCKQEVVKQGMTIANRGIKSLAQIA